MVCNSVGYRSIRVCRSPPAIDAPGRRAHRGVDRARECELVDPGGRGDLRHPARRLTVAEASGCRRSHGRNPRWRDCGTVHQFRCSSWKLLSSSGARDCSSVRTVTRPCTRLPVRLAEGGIREWRGLVCINGRYRSSRESRSRPALAALGRSAHRRVDRARWHQLGDPGDRSPSRRTPRRLNAASDGCSRT